MYFVSEQTKVSLVTFATYVLTSEANQLSVEKVLVSIALFDLMKLPLTILPMLSVDIAEVQLPRWRWINNLFGYGAPLRLSYIHQLQIKDQERTFYQRLKRNCVLSFRFH